MVRVKEEIMSAHPVRDSRPGNPNGKLHAPGAGKRFVFTTLVLCLDLWKKGIPNV